MKLQEIKDLLEEEYIKRNNETELSEDKPDPLMIAREHMNEYIILTCALFAYGNAKQIVKFLKKLPFDVVDRGVSENTIRERCKGLKYRFQTEEDIIQWFLTLQNIRKKEKQSQKGREPKSCLLQETCVNGYKEENNTIQGIYNMIELIYENSNGYTSNGFKFLIGQKNKSPLKRWNMFLRWLVRDDNLDLGMWLEIDKKDLIIPLDTHLFNIGKKLKLITKNKSYNLKSAIEITENLRKIEQNDPLKYDFVIYRLGQEKLI